jgi:uncharacterized membrane protein YqjE
MLNALRKSKQLTSIALERLGDYLALLRIELQMQGREMRMQLLGFFTALMGALYGLLFIGVAIIVSFWDSEYRAIAAWITAALYLGLAGAGIAFARRHTGKAAVLTTLREEIKRDAELIRESL